MSTVFRLPLVLFFKLEHPEIHFCPDSLFSPPSPPPLCFLSIYFAPFLLLLLLLLILSQLMTTNTQMVSLSPSLSALSVSHASSLFCFFVFVFLRPCCNVSWFFRLDVFHLTPQHVIHGALPFQCLVSRCSINPPTRVPNKLHWHSRNLRLSLTLSVLSCCR